MSEVKSRILELRNLIIEHNHNYYDLDKNLISDFEYDNLINELIKLENQYPEFQDQNSTSSMFPKLPAGRRQHGERSTRRV